MMRTYVKDNVPDIVELTDKMYIRDLDRVSPGSDGFFTDEAIREQIRLYRETNDNSIRTNIINTYGRYVVSIAKNYQRMGVPLCDLITEGMIGLINAIVHFDLENQTKFITYSNNIISRQIREALDQFNLPVKVPKNIRNQHRKVRTLIEEKFLLGEDEDAIIDKVIDDEISYEYYLNQGLYSKVLVGNSQTDDSQCENLEDIYFISDEAPDKRLTKVDLKREIARIFRKKLTKTEAKVLRLYFGIDSPYAVNSTADLGAKLGMSGERARQIKEAGLAKLRSADCKKILANYL